MTAPLITVGIPFYNNEDTLLDSIKSIFAQTFHDWEMILVDDGSTDGSLDIAQSIDDPRVKVISDGHNKKLAMRLNQIIDLSHGEYITRMDADDICSPRRLEKQLELFQKEEGLNVVGTGVIYLGLGDIPLGISSACTSHAEICRNPSQTIKLCHPSVMATKTWYEKNRYNEALPLSQDYELWLRSYCRSRFANISEPLYYYRLDSSFSLKKQFKDRCIVAGILWKHHSEQNRLEKALIYSLLPYVKFTVEAGYCLAGLKNKLLARRYSKLTESQMIFYQSEIQNIKNTNLPVK